MACYNDNFTNFFITPKCISWSQPRSTVGSTQAIKTERWYTTCGTSAFPGHYNCEFQAYVIGVTRVQLHKNKITPPTPINIYMINIG
jgi:hypothetical protein